MAGIKIDTIQNPEHKAIAGEIDELYGNGDGMLDVGDEQSLFRDTTGADPKSLRQTDGPSDGKTEVPAASTSASYCCVRCC